MALIAWREDDRTLVSGWGRIGFARMLVGATLGVYAFTDTVGVDEGRVVHYVGVALAIVVLAVGAVHLAPGLRDSFRAAVVFLAVDGAVGLAFMWLFAFDRGQYTFGLIYLVLIETAAVLGRSAALGGWFGASTLYVVRHLALVPDGLTISPTGVALRVSLAAAIAVAADAVVAELRSERRRMSDLLHDLDAFVWEADAVSGVITFASEASSRLFDRDAVELLGVSDLWNRIVHPDDLPAVVGALEEAAASDEPQGFECRILTAGGRERWLAGRVHRVRAQHALLIRGLATDVTDRKRAEASEARLAAIVDGTEVAIVGRTVDGTITSVNPAAERLLQIRETDAVGTPFASLIPPDRRAEARDLEERVMRGEHVREVETVRLRSDGTAVPVAVTLSPIRDESGRVEGIAGLMRDLTAELQTREALRESQEMFRAAFEQAPFGVGLATIDGTIIRVNRTFAQMLGYGQSELERRSIASITIPEDYDAQRALQEAAIRDGRDGYELEKRYRRRNGSIMSGRAVYALVRDANGDPVYWIAQVEDVTDRRRTDEELRRTVAALEARGAEMTILGEIGDLLAACEKADEAHLVLARAIPRLLPETSGAIYLINASRDLAERIAAWGDDVEEVAFGPNECWGLRRGRVHRVADANVDIPCPHIRPMPGTHYVCVPMMAQGEGLGVLHVRQASAEASGAHGAAFVSTVAEHVALALSNFRLRETLREQSIRDPVTGLFNRRFMEESFERELNRAKRSGSALSVMMLDVDHLKRLNDTLGHQAGDRLIRETGRYIQRSVRVEDVACRFGGDEFVLLMPDAPLETAAIRAKEIVEGFRRLDLGGGAVQPTLSAGVAAFPDHGDAAESLMRAADGALYRAKGGGRDRAEVAEA